MLTVSFRNLMLKRVTLAAHMAVLILVGGAAAQAQTYLVSLDTTGLNASDSYAVDLQLNQGDTSTPTSTVTASNFLFVGGSADMPGAPYSSGPVTGDLSSGVILTTTGNSSSEYSQNFTNGASISFNVDATLLSASADGVTPDEFIFDLYDNTAGVSVPTTDAMGNSSPGGIELFALTRDSTGYHAQTYGYTDANSIFYQTQAIDTSAAPEPSQYAAIVLACMGVSGLLLRARYKTHSVA